MTVGDGDAVSSTVRRWQLTESLRQLREQAGFTMHEAADELRKQPGKWSRSKLQRIETRDQKVKYREVEQLLDLYEVTDSDLRAWLLALASTANERGYWLAIRKEFPHDFRGVLEVEGALVAQRQLETMVVPGLLQTPDWARAVMTGGSPDLSAETIERRVMARMARQQVLTRAEPLRLHAIIDEPVLERPVGSDAIMREQLKRLVECAQHEHITIQVLPMSAGATPAVDGSFSILTLPEPIPDFGYAEAPGGTLYIEDRDEVRNYTLRFGVLTERALSPEESTVRIERAAQQFAKSTA
ncbi:Helix-turn-helix domain-containing protein [Actinopolyspora mzabensis]|uniref:Helix-turn-helix domain-containing protein n=1 Tax=Actinopolyspora mzabensis TaxID=995066 RepID=A0A1G9E7Q9_ACTMZ|nr:helix-turn-helix transcriptional regulator [Actinopolyspora mzabensis]SDK72163.1 Helix-turn-helix domain-containing protein [Actinopolyspora mzabensis]